MTAYYNEINSFAAQWLRNLIAEGHIAPGEVDERSIKEVSADDLRGFTQCHFFAGIGGWSLAARLAGWPDDRPLWTGSCPCQPFSTAGAGEGFADPRDLWPELRRLIAARRPERVAGEQVEGIAGRAWLDRLRADLELEDYESGASVLCASLAGLPTRTRLYWLAVSNRGGECGSAVDAEVAGLSPVAERHSARVVDELVSGSDGLPGSMGRRRGYGNAIVPEVGALFLRAALEAA